MTKWCVKLLSIVGFGLFSIYITSCVPDSLEVKGIPVVKPQIVVSTQIIPDQSLVVLLTKTFGALDISEDSDPQAVLDQIAVEDATVTITGNGTEYTLAPLGNGFYGGTLIEFVEGEVYDLLVDSESLGEVTATTTVQRQVGFENIKAELYFTGYDDSLAQITYSFNDPEEKNWYMLNVMEVEVDEIQEDLLNPYLFTRLLEDTQFNGRKYTETFRVFPQDFETGDTIAVYLSNISASYYDFMQLRLDNRFSFIQFLSEPVNYPSNVKGGKGFFNLYIPDIRFFVF